MEIIIIISFILLVIGLIIWFYISNKKSSNKIEQPKEQISNPISNPIEQPIEQPTEPVVAEPESKIESEFESSKHLEKYLDCLLEKFKEIVEVKKDSITYNYLKELIKEATAQYVNNRSCNNLPVLFIEDNFPQVYNYYGDDGSEDDTLNTLCYWLIAMQLSELTPYNRTKLGKIGYEIAYNKHDDIYGYSFKNDPNIARIVAGAIYASMRGRVKPDINSMRKELGGTKYNESLSVLADGKRDKVDSNDFFTDFREFMPTAPGPYAPNYTNRPDNTYPNEQKDECKNLKIDRDIYEMIVKDYNLDSSKHFQECVQAIADKEADAGHMFGSNKQTKHYHFHPIFGKDTIDMEFSPESTIAILAQAAFAVSSSSRGILQSASVNPKQYGRLRPGCSWVQEGYRNSLSDDRRNVLVNFEIEDGDGSPTGYYDKDGNWVYMNGIHNPEEFNDKSKNQLYANSYPSGHSAGIMGAAMVLMELIPDKADKILKTANQYAINRTISRYHWTSDTINGRVLGSLTNAVAHASSDYDMLLEKSYKEIKNYAL